VFSVVVFCVLLVCLRSQLHPIANFRLLKSVSLQQSLRQCAPSRPYARVRQSFAQRLSADEIRYAVQALALRRDHNQILSIDTHGEPERAIVHAVELDRSIGDACDQYVAVITERFRKRAFRFCGPCANAFEL
jgi:hypothetical protein